MIHGIDTKTLFPSHVAFIMDGNRRWAKKNNLPIIDGHKKGAEIIKKIVSKSIKLNIKYLTFYGFSTENWNRSKVEVIQLQSLLKLYLDSETDNFLENKINFSFIGNIEKFDSPIRKKLYKLRQVTNSFNKLFFTDKSLENFFFIDIILELFPNAKFIHCKRNKVDNIFAIYQNFLTKMSWTHSLEDIIKYFDNYLNVMTIFNKRFKEKIFSIKLEDLTLNSKKISQDVFKFCNLEWSENSLEYHKRKDLFSTTASNIQIREKIYKYNNEKYEVYKKHIKKFEQKYNWLKKDLL